MTREIITHALEAEGFKSGAQGYPIPEEREATCLVTSPGELLTVSRVAQIELRDKYLVVRTSRNEQFVFSYDSVLAFRWLGRSQGRDHAAGFSR